LEHQSVQNDFLPLGSVRPGNLVRVARIEQGKVFRQRLLNLGIVPGVEIRAVRGGRGYPMVLEVQGAKVVLGAGMASHVFVVPA